MTLKTADGLEVELLYGVFEQADVIARSLRFINGSRSPVQLLRALSFQLDLPAAAGRWRRWTAPGRRERHVTEHRLAPGAVAFGSRTGASSNRTNPFFMIYEDGAASLPAGLRLQPGLLRQL